MTKKSGLILCVAASVAMVLDAGADLLVLRPGGENRSAIVHFKEPPGRFVGTTTANTEGFYGLAQGPDGSVYATGNTLGYGEIFRFTADGRALGRFGGENLRAPGNLKFGPDGNLYVLSSTWPESPAQGQVLRYNGQTGAFMDVFVVPGAGGAGTLTDLAFGPDGHLYVSDFERGILRFNGQTGEFMGVFVPAGRKGLNAITAFAFGRDGLYVASRDSNSVLKFDSRTGAFLRVLVPNGRGGLRAPSGLAFARNGQLYVSSYQNNRVLRYNSRTGQFLGAVIAANPQVSRPTKLLFTGK